MGECISKELAPPAAAAGVNGKLAARSNLKRLDTSFTTAATDKTLEMDRAETLSDSTTGSGSGEEAEPPPSPQGVSEAASPEWPGARPGGPPMVPEEGRKEVPKESPEEGLEESPTRTESAQEQDVLGELPPPRPSARPSRQPRRTLEPPRSLRGEVLPRSTFSPPPAGRYAASDALTPVRAEQEKNWLSLAGSKEEESGVRATAHSLRFQDAEGCSVSYRLRPSKKKSCATFLELTVEGEAPRKVRSIVHDPVRHTLADKKSAVSVPPGDEADVLKSLRLLCKISMVKLESSDGVPAGGMRKVGSDANLTTRPSSTNSLSRLDQKDPPKAMRRVHSNLDFRSSGSMTQSHAGFRSQAPRRPLTSDVGAHGAGGLAQSSPPIIARSVRSR